MTGIPALESDRRRDALSSNAPHSSDLQRHKLRFILGAEPGDHDSLFTQLKQAAKDETVTDIQFLDLDDRKKSPYSAGSLIYRSLKKTSSSLRAGRARWKVENETIKTLKNQGYNLGHSYGMGKMNLNLVFTS